MLYNTVLFKIRVWYVLVLMSKNKVHHELEILVVRIVRITNGFCRRSDKGYHNNKNHATYYRDDTQPLGSVWAA